MPNEKAKAFFEELQELYAKHGVRLCVWMNEIGIVDTERQELAAVWRPKEKPVEEREKTALLPPYKAKYYVHQAKPIYFGEEKPLHYVRYINLYDESRYSFKMFIIFDGDVIVQERGSIEQEWQTASETQIVEVDREKDDLCRITRDIARTIIATLEAEGYKSRKQVNKEKENYGGQSPFGDGAIIAIPINSIPEIDILSEGETNG